MRREQTLADRITGSALWRSVVRHGYPDTQRNQALIIASNVFLHIHPVKIKRYATKVTYTFCLGGLSFFMFLVPVMTGVLLMFTVRRPTCQSMKDIEQRDRSAYAQHAMEAQGMVLPCSCTWAGFYTGSYKPRVQLGGRRALPGCHLPAFLHRLPAPWISDLLGVTVGAESVGYPDHRPTGEPRAPGDYQIGRAIRFTLHVIFLPLVAAF